MIGGGEGAVGSANLAASVLEAFKRLLQLRFLLVYTLFIFSISYERVVQTRVSDGARSIDIESGASGDVYVQEM